MFFAKSKDESIDLIYLDPPFNSKRDHISCDKCRVPFVNEDQLISKFTKDELKIIVSIILKDWRVYILAGILLFSAVFLLDWKVSKKIETQVKAIQNRASNRIDQAYSNATKEVEAKFVLFAQNASNKIESSYSAVTNQVAEQFQTPRIKEVIENVAKGEAKGILEAEVRPTVKKFESDAEFLRVATRARGYDFKAYLRLLEMRQETNELAKYAESVIAESDRALQRDRLGVQRTFQTFEGTNFFKGPFTTDELAIRFSGIQKDPTSLNREGFVNTVTTLQQPLFLSRLIEFFTNETDLAVADRLTISISGITKEDFHPRDFG